MPRFIFISLLAIALGQPLVDGDELSKIRIKLRSSDKWVRKTAVQDLAKLDRIEAWELVVEALGDRNGEVADTAQLVLAGIDEEEELRLVLGPDGMRSRDEWVRRRAAEALGRIATPTDPRRLVRALTDSDAGVRRATAWSVERLARAGRVNVDEKFGLAATLARKARKDRDDGVRARCLFALDAVDHPRCRTLAREIASDKAKEVRCAIAALCPALFDESEALERLVRYAADPARAVRVQALESLAALGSRAGLLPLIDRLEAEPEERLLVRIVELLRELSGRRHRRDPRPWRAWAKTLPADWRPVVPVIADAADDSDRSTTLDALPILSRRVCFLIDMSGSMWAETADGRTLKEVVGEMLTGVFARLPADTRFNVIPYTEKPRLWKKALAPATPGNIRSATRFFQKCSDQGTGNFWRAAMAALEDPDVDTLVVVTDGDPTGGRRHRLELMVPLFAELNATRKIALDSILIDATKHAQWHWGRFAADSAGRSIRVEM